jgi:hypothetical protein
VLSVEQKRPNWREISLAWLVLSGVLLAVYSKIITQVYGLHDDYSHLWVVTFGQQYLFGLYGTQGRFIHQWLSTWAFGLVDTVADLALLRWFALAALSVFALQIYYLARRMSWPPVAALCLSFSICTTPAVGIYAAWAITFPVVLALILGLQAGALMVLKPNRMGLPNGFYIVLASLLLIAALALYQHAAMAFWLALALYYFAPQTALFCWRRVVVSLGVFGFSLLAYYAIFKGYVAYFQTDAVLLEGAARATFSDDPLGKLIFFLQSLSLAASIGQIDNSITIALGVGFIFGAAWLILPANRWLGLLGLVLLLVAYLPSWIVQESLLKLRLLGVLSSLLIVLLFWAVSVLLRQWPRYLSAILIGISIFVASSEWRNIQQLISLHQAEYRAVQEALLQHYQADSKAIVITRPAPQNWLSGGPSTLEYGIPTSALLHADFARVLVQQIFAETFATENRPEVIQCTEPERADCAELLYYPDLPLLHLSQLIQAQLPKDWPITGY